MDTRQAPRSQIRAHPKGVSCPSWLFIMYTDSCRTSPEGSCLVKFSDDTTLLSLFFMVHSQITVVPSLPFVKWCSANFLDGSLTLLFVFVILFLSHSSNFLIYLLV